MPRLERIDVGNNVYHILNRANARAQIFYNDNDYKLFESILEEAVEKFKMRLLAYCLMPNHWHLVLYPRNDGDLALFISWLTNTHTRRWHTEKGTVGEGHLYQGRYKSFLCQDDGHFLTLVRYVERNAKKAKLVLKSVDWPWSSVWRREKGTDKQKKILAPWPVPRPENYLLWLDQSQSEEEEGTIELSVLKSSPFGSLDWMEDAVKKFNLEQTLRRVGRPRKGG